MEFHLWFAIVIGLVAGLIDSIAGGGGLITVPALGILMGPGVHAIATNKIAATFSSLVALIIYFGHGHVSLTKNWHFAFVVGIGSIIGSQVAPFLPSAVFKWMLVVIAPTILILLWKKDLWLQSAGASEARADKASLLASGNDMGSIAPSQDAENRLQQGTTRTLLIMLGSGLICGFYDGIAGPGGGTFMFLSLFLFAKLPLMTALATAKIANVTSASLSLTSYSLQGLVDWHQGAPMALGISVGAMIGASYASRNSTSHVTGLVRVALAAVASLLILRLLTLP